MYLDNAATTMVCPEAAQAALETMTESYGNPSSTHTMGREAAKKLEYARARLANALGAEAQELYFTSGGTESVNWALLSGAKLMKRHGKHIISSGAEHSAALKTLGLLEKSGFEITRLKPQRDGSVSAGSVAEALREDTALVSLMLVNNETGGITDVPAVSRLLKDAGSGAVLHTDAVQGFLKLPFTAKSLGAQMISLSGHKVHAPKGVGALYIASGLKNLEPLLVGGSQEGNKRAGTQALPLIAAFGAAAEAGQKSFEENLRHMEEIKKLTSDRLTAENPGLQILSGGAPHILSVSLPGCRSEVLMNFLEAREIFVSKSSACKKGGRSYVLEAAGHSPGVIDGALRIGFSRYTTKDEALAFCEALKAASERLCTGLRR